MSHLNPEEWVPRWAYSAEAEAWLGDKVFNKSYTTVVEAKDGREILGPSKLWAYRGLGVLWAFFIVNPFVALLPSSCAPPGPAKLPAALLGIYACCLASCLWMEFQALRQAIILPSRNCAPFKFLGVALTFRQWILLAVALSALGHMDVSSSGLVMAKALATDFCGGGPDELSIPTVWRRVMKKSFGWQWLGLGELPFSALACAAWALMLLQPLYALVTSTPVPWRRRPGYTLEFFEQNTEGASDYETLGNCEQNHFTSLTILADAGRFESIAMACQEQIHFLARTDKSFQTLGATWYEMKRVTMRYGLRNVLEAGFLINVQVTFLALIKVTAEQNGLPYFDLVTHASITLTLMSAAKTLFFTTIRMNMLYGYVKSLAAGMRDYQRIMQNPFMGAVNDVEEIPGYIDPDVVERGAWLTRSLFVFFAVLSVLIFGYATIKLVMIHVCQDAIWSFGCVDIS